MVEMYPAAELRLIRSGHCPQDDSPQEANRELLDWLGGLSSTSNGNTGSSNAGVDE